MSAANNILGTYELARVLHAVVSIVENSSDDHVFGEKRKYIDPKAEGIRLILEKKAPIYIERTLIPDEPNSKEQIDIRNLMFDEELLKGVFDLLKDNGVMIEKPTDEELLEWRSEKVIVRS